MAEQQNVIDKITKIVKRWGYCDFENDGSFDSDTEEIIVMEFVFDPDIDVIDWEYDTETETFVEVVE